MAMTTPIANGKLTPVDAQRVFGVRGLRNRAGRITEEYLAILKDWSKAKLVYTEMLDDLVISTLLDALKLPLLAAEFDTKPASDSLPDNDAALWLWDAMNGMRHQSWRSHVTDALEAIEWGFAVSEITLEKRLDGRLWLRNVDPRGQDTLFAWEFDDYDVATVFRQQSPNTGALLDIPLDKCVHVTLQGRKGSPQGKPLLRYLHRDWRFLRNLEDLEAIGVERDVGGMPVFTLPEEPVSDSDIVRLQAALKDLRMDEEMYFILPHGAGLDAYGAGQKSYDIGAIIERKEKKIFMRRFAQFLKLGMDNVGTQALVEGSHDFFMLGLEGIQQQLLEAWNDQLVPFLFRYNLFAGMTDYPQITWARPGAVDVKAILDAYSIAVDKKLITPTREDEEWIRPQLGAPDLPEGLGLEPRDQVEQPWPVTALPLMAATLSDRTLAKFYDPNQPRNDQGEWTDTGVGGSGLSELLSIKAEERAKIPSLPTLTERMDAGRKADRKANERFVERHPIVDFSVTDTWSSLDFPAREYYGSLPIEPKTYFHVAPASYKVGDDLLSWQAQKKIGMDIGPWKWDRKTGKNDVFLFDTKGEALEYVDIFASKNSQLLQVSVSDVAGFRRDMEEGYVIRKGKIDGTLVTSTGLVK